jgi:isoleucyl-tRNA synthetase
LLSDWPAINPQWDNEQLEKDFAELLKAREVVSRAIEPLRNSEEKIIGSSLEACIYISASNELLLKKYEDDLKDLFIVSQVYIDKNPTNTVLSELEADGYSVKVLKAQGEKCPRCWKYRKLGTQGICKECTEAITL